MIIAPALLALVLACLLPLPSLGLERLCEAPQGPVPNPLAYNLKCKIATGSFIGASLYLDSQRLLLMEYNMDEGNNWKKIVAQIKSLPVWPTIILISEASRGCVGVSGGEFVLEEMARELGMAYVYAPEFLQTQPKFEYNCTTGNGILSLFPIEDPDMIRYKSQCCWFPNRLGGRNSVLGTVMLGGKKLRLNSLHLESGTSILNQPKAYKYKLGSASEILSNLQGWQQANPEGGSIVSGDFNSPFLSWDPVVRLFFANNFADSHRSLTPFWKRQTDSKWPVCYDYLLSSFGCLTPTLIRDRRFKDLSDHWPIFAELDMDCWRAADAVRAV